MVVCQCLPAGILWRQSRFSVGEFAASTFPFGKALVLKLAASSLPCGGSRTTRSEAKRHAHSTGTIFLLLLLLSIYLYLHLHRYLPRLHPV
eukprot:765108-Hanusia_phi.AAC.1